MRDRCFAHRAPGERNLPYLFTLQRRLFLFFGATILVTVVAAGLLVHLLPGPPWGAQWERVHRLFGDELERVWDKPQERRDLAARVARTLDLGVEVRDAEGKLLEQAGPTCRRPLLTAPVAREGVRLGEVRACAEHTPRARWRALVPLLVVGLALWWTAGRLSRRILRPLSIVVRLAEDLGEGKLGARAQLTSARHSEEQIVAQSLNRMADRIERQIADQRELLAAVSHEMRTPLGHLRLLIEMARDGGADKKLLSELEKEIAEIDALTGDLLANSRLNFATLSMKPLDAGDLARRALERAGLPASLLEAPEDLAFEADPTLLSRALANLLENAHRHAGGPTRLTVKRDRALVRFTVEDDGPGFAPGEEAKAFDAFRPRTHGSNGTLGLGLNLVQRIARAHGGEAFAENRGEGGARVGFSVRESGQEPKA
jgi:signal transduction histidine kinase